MRKFLYILILSFLYTSCSDKKLVTQTVSSASDCICSEGWSWSNGEASTIENNSQNEHSFSFKSIVSGELSFSHHMMPIYDNTYSSNLLRISIGGKVYFQITLQDDGIKANYIETSIGSVKAGEEITFTGRRYYVKGVKIVGESGEPSNGGSDYQWDF